MVINGPLHMSPFVAIVRSPLVTISLTGIAVLTALLAPIPNGETAWALYTTHSQMSGVSFVIGNSVIDAKSQCDSDRRTIPDLLTDDSGKPVINLSMGGQSITTSLNYALWALRNGAGRKVVLYLSAFSFQETLDVGLQKQLLFFLTNRELPLNQLPARFQSGVFLEPRASLNQQPFTYGGVHYPGYSGLFKTYYTREKALQRCPERLGVDRAFIEANYWKVYALADFANGNVNALRLVQDLAETTKNQLLIVLLPVDYDDVRQLNSALSETIIGRVSALTHALARSGIRFLDLTSSVGMDGFTDRYCACGHLNAAGRKAVVQQTIVYSLSQEAK